MRKYWTKARLKHSRAEFKSCSQLHVQCQRAPMAQPSSFSVSLLDWFHFLSTVLLAGNDSGATNIWGLRCNPGFPFITMACHPLWPFMQRVPCPALPVLSSSPRVERKTVHTLYSCALHDSKGGTTRVALPDLAAWLE